MWSGIRRIVKRTGLVLTTVAVALAFIPGDPAAAGDTKKKYQITPGKMIKRPDTSAAEPRKKYQLTPKKMIGRPVTTTDLLKSKTLPPAPKSKAEQTRKTVASVEPAKKKKKKRKRKRKSYPSFFNSRETPSKNLKPFKKWNAALKRYTKESAGQQKGGCDAKKMTKCHYEEWTRFINTLKGKDKLAQIKAVNAHVNKAKYVTDKVNWGKKDYWATPGEFMARFGDCEDYAIAKYMTLKQLGYTYKDMRVVAVKDLNLKVGHAVLVVFVGKDAYLLDNQIKKVVGTKSVKHYMPVFSITEKMWWRHRVSPWFRGPARSPAT